jgi:soluble lytic murein transglycosylase-like protein
VSVPSAFRVLPLLCLATTLGHPAIAAPEHRLAGLGFERSLNERQLLRAWHRQTGSRDPALPKSANEPRPAPQIRRITDRDIPQSKYWRLAPVSGAMAGRRERYAPLISAAATRHGVDPNLVHAAIRAESAYRSRAKSHAGACGLMQLIPATAKRFGVRDIWDPEQNIEGGVAYLRFLQGRFDGDIRLALAAYNAGEGAVAKYGNRIPPYRETQTYVRRVLGYLGAA